VGQGSRLSCSLHGARPGGRRRAVRRCGLRTRPRRRGCDARVCIVRRPAVLTWGGASRVLIADDSDAQVRLLRRVLETDGYHCASASSGEQALDACASEAIDLVLLDVKMPGPDGFTVCRKLKAGATTHLIPVLIMTGAADPGSRL